MRSTCLEWEAATREAMKETESSQTSAILVKIVLRYSELLYLYERELIDFYWTKNIG